jgi:hypothetical protein
MSTELYQVSRLIRERRTVAALFDLYCHHQHGTQGELCATCGSLAAYAAERLARCRFGPQKPTCARCPVHCYGPRQREEIKHVMRYAGPRMLLRHPVWALMHAWDGWRANAGRARTMRKPDQIPL